MNMNILGQLTDSTSPETLETLVEETLSNPNIRVSPTFQIIKESSVTPELIDKIAKSKGYSIGPVYHGTGSNFNIFDMTKISRRMEGGGIYFTTDYNTALGYATNGRVVSAYLNIKNPLDYSAKPFSTTKIKKLLSTLATLEEKANGIGWQDGFLSNCVYTYDLNLSQAVAKAAEFFKNDKSAIDQLGGLIGAGVSPSLVNDAMEQALGYDGYKSDGFSGEGKGGGTIWVAIRPNQIKSSATVTKDDSGNIIPLDKRFDSSSNDIRF